MQPLSEAQLCHFRGSLSRDGTGSFASPRRDKQAMRQKLADDVEAYLARGGRITQAPEPDWDHMSRSVSVHLGLVVDL